MGRKTIINAVFLCAGWLLAASGAPSAAEPKNGWAAADLENIVGSCIEAATSNMLEKYKADEGITGELPPDAKQRAIAAIEPAVQPVCDCIADEASATLTPGDADKPTIAALVTELTASGGKCAP
ncbi:MAG: hypothetical protein ACR2Q4_03255 [Geminicoccaceae bacterium]